MKKGMIALLVALGALVLIFLWGMGQYNGMVTAEENLSKSWANVESQYQRRADLIPNLVSTVKGYAKHEKGVFEEVTKARAEALSAKNLKAKSDAENKVSEALKSIFAVAEAYPDLKASQNFSKLQDELTDTEDKIQASRRFYNANVRDLNIAIQSFPTNVIANMFKFSKKELFGLEEAAAKEPVKVSFDK